MKLLRFLFIVPIIFLLINSCSSESSSEEKDLTKLFDDRESSCTSLSAYSGAYWDFINELDVLWPIIPKVTDVNVEFTHSQLPISLNLPNGYIGLEAEFPIIYPNSKAFEVFNANESVKFTWIAPTYIENQYIPSKDFLPVNRFLLSEDFGLTGEPLEICSEFIQNDSKGFPQEINSEIIRFNDFTAQVWTLISYLDEGTTYVSSISVAPTEIYEQITKDLFLPLNFQLYMVDKTTQLDKDGDGFSVLTDPDDNDNSIPKN